MDDEIRKILDNFFATHELPKVNYVLKSDDDETENNHPLQSSEEATIQTVPQTFEPTVPDYYPDAPPYSPPFDKYSDMLKACKLAMADLPEWCDYINEARSTVHEMPVRRLYLSPKDFTIKYSQPSESLRIISEIYNICVTVRYNYWDDERDEFTDKAFFYPLDAIKTTNDGCLMQVGVNNGQFAIGFGFTEFLTNTICCSSMSKDEANQNNRYQFSYIRGIKPEYTIGFNVKQNDFRRRYRSGDYSFDQYFIANQLALFMIFLHKEKQSGIENALVF